MPQETKKTLKKKKKLTMLLGDKILIATAIGVIVFKGTGYFLKTYYRVEESQKVERIEPNLYEPNIYEFNIHDSNDFNKPYNLKKFNRS